MNPYVEQFIEKIADETPEFIGIHLGRLAIQFQRMQIIHELIPDIDDWLTSEPYKVSYSEEYYADLEGQPLYLAVQHRYNPETTYDRLEVHVPRRKFQLTCLHFGQIGLTSGQNIVEFSQRVTFVNRDGNNNVRKEQACKLLREAGLLLEEPNKAPRWCVGEYNVGANSWLRGYTTQKFFEDFIKAALIMGALRGHDQELELISAYLAG